MKGKQQQKRKNKRKKDKEKVKGKKVKTTIFTQTPVDGQLFSMQRITFHIHFKAHETKPLCYCLISKDRTGYLK